jgi:hypothetical protein
VTPTFVTPVHYTLPEFRTMLAGLKLDAWRPKFPTLHNTGAPNLKQWLAYGPTPQERWGASLNRYYQGLGWHAGPHLVVCPDYVWVLCDLAKSGVSVSCWNSETFGIEMVGDYDVGAEDDFSTGEGAKVRDNAVAVLAACAEKFGWGDLAEYQIGVRGLHFHRECANDHHSCPGGQVGKPDMLARVAAARGSSPTVPAATSATTAPTASGQKSKPVLASSADIQAALNTLDVPPIEAVDGAYGPITIERVKLFQKAHHLDADGWAGKLTCAAIKAALTP